MCRVNGVHPFTVFSDSVCEADPAVCHPVKRTLAQPTTVLGRKF